MFCEKCGFKNNDGVAFCTNCGAPMQSNQSNNQQYQQPNQQYQQPNQQYQQPNQQYQQYQQPNQQVIYVQNVRPTVPGKGMSITAMVLGIVACVFSCYFFISLPCAIVGIILGVLGNSKAKSVGLKSGFAVAGIACSAVSLGLTILFILYVVLVVGSVYASFDDFMDYDYYYTITSLFNRFLG